MLDGVDFLVEACDRGQRVRLLIGPIGPLPGEGPSTRVGQEQILTGHQSRHGQALQCGNWTPAAAILAPEEVARGGKERVGLGFGVARCRCRVIIISLS